MSSDFSFREIGIYRGKLEYYFTCEGGTPSPPTADTNVPAPFVRVADISPHCGESPSAEGAFREAISQL